MIEETTIVKAIGAVAGAILALSLMPPNSWNGFFRRLLTSVIAGLVFANPMREWLTWVNTAENLTAAACVAAFSSWWVMGSVVRVIRAWREGKTGDDA